MAQTYVPADLRRTVSARAAGRCEYCLLPQALFPAVFQIDHVAAEKHGGPTTAANLALACPRCNQAKGTDLGSIDWPAPPADAIDWERCELVRFFNPRRDRWGDHFRLDGGRIDSLTPVGWVTARVFDLNSPERIEERVALAAVGRYPPPDPPAA